MKLVFAPDSFKGTLGSIRICELLETAARSRLGGDLEILRAPLADGGEGTVDALLEARGGEKERVWATGPYGERVSAAYARLPGGEYAMEMAQSSGLALTERREPLLASSAGTGEVLGRLLDMGARRVLIGIGGSATNDGGTGFLRALGAVFTDGNGKEIVPNGAALGRIAKADFSALRAELRETRIDVICDVTNPLCGPEGATNVYGPQKGADGDSLPILEAGMRSYARVLERALGRPVGDFPGAGAAGGMGAALGGVLGATMRSGVDAMLAYARFDEMLNGASLCVTGEGRLDGQSVRYGKAVSGVARRCAAAGVPLAVIAGGLGEGAREIYDICPCALTVTPDGPMSLPEAMRNAESLFADAADRLFRTLRIGASMR